MHGKGGIMPESLIVLRGEVVEAVAGTLVEQEVNTPVDQNLLLAMNIHKIVLEISAPTPNAAAPVADAAYMTPAAIAVSTRQGLAVIPNWGDSGTIARNRIYWSERSQAGDTGNGLTGWNGEMVQFTDYPNGLLVADRTLSVYVIGSALHGSTMAGRFAIFYTMKKVAAVEYMAALSVVAAL